MVDQNYIGTELPPYSVDIEAGRLRFFAVATGQADPVYTDESAARAAGYRSLPAPPTFLFGLELDSDPGFNWLQTMGVELARMLHGEQSFTYHQPVCAGDRVTLKAKIVDIYSKKGGALDFIVKDTSVFNQQNQLVAELRSVIVQR